MANKTAIDQKSKSVLCQRRNAETVKEELQRLHIAMAFTHCDTFNISTVHTKHSFSAAVSCHAA